MRAKYVPPRTGSKGNLGFALSSRPFLSLQAVTGSEPPIIATQHKLSMQLDVPPHSELNTHGLVCSLCWLPVSAVWKLRLSHWYFPHCVHEQNLLSAAIGLTHISIRLTSTNTRLEHPSRETEEERLRDLKFNT